MDTWASAKRGPVAYIMGNLRGTGSANTNGRITG
jgi:hypothetical protein